MPSRPFDSHSDKFLKDAVRHQRLIDEALGVGSYASDLAYKSRRSVDDLGRQVAEASSFKAYVRDLADFGRTVRSNRELNRSFGSRIGDLAQFAADAPGFASRTSGMISAISHGVFDRPERQLGLRVARELDAISASMADLVLGAKRGISDSSRPSAAIGGVAEWRKLNKTIAELTRPLGSRLADADPTFLSEARTQRWIREARRERAFWEAASADMATLSGVGDEAPDRLLAVLQRVVAHLWSNTKSKSRTLDLFDIANLLATLLTLAALVAPLLPEEADAPERQATVETSRALADAVQEITRWLNQHDLAVAARRGDVVAAAWVRQGPDPVSAKLARLPAHTEIGLRGERPHWRLVLYRDPLTGDLAEGWVPARLLRIWNGPSQAELREK